MVTPERTVAKFGGTSVADAAGLRQVAAIVAADPARQVVVVSAPGKAAGDPHKVTDMLYMCQQLASHDLGFGDVWALVERRFLGIRDELRLSTDLEPALEETRALIAGGADAGHVASRGEYLNARLVADLLGYDFVDAADVVVMSSDGGLVLPATMTAVGHRIPPGTRAVVPGFYGADPDGHIHALARGGSDITGALIARGVGAGLYENWTDVPGFLMADPGIVAGPKRIAELTYAELRELSYMGAQVLQEDAIFPVREAGIPIHVRSTFTPEIPGTMIVPEAIDRPRDVITGLAGKRDFAVVTVEKTRMRSHADFIRKLTSVFESNEITVEHLPSGIDSISVVVPAAQLAPVQRKVLEEIRIYCTPDHVSVSGSIGLLAVVGHGMIHERGVSARVFTALAAAGVNIRLIMQGASELNILVGMANADFDKAMRAVYDEFVEKEA